MVYLVYGAPCSGKTTYIKNHKRLGDLVCDTDLLYSAISMDDGHNAENLYIQMVAKELNETLTDIIKTRRGKWRDAYVVSVANTKEKLQKEKERVNADKVIFMNTPLSVCLERSKERPFYFSWLIQEWFEKSDFDLSEE